MEVTKENLEVALDHLKSQWVYYWKKKKENPKWVCSPTLEFQEGDMVYINLDVNFPHEMCFGHWCYVVKDMEGKLLVIPSTSVKDGCPYKYEMDINVTLDGRKMKEFLEGFLVIDILVCFSWAIVEILMFILKMIGVI